VVKEKGLRRKVMQDEKLKNNLEMKNMRENVLHC
jgi:hypothetical protein